MGERRGSLNPQPGPSATGAGERTPLLPSYETRNRLWSFRSSSSSESSLTISSLDSSESSAFIPWYWAESNDVEVTPPTPDTDPPEYPEDDEALQKDDGTSLNPIKKVIAILILGMFTANADGSLVLATHSTIASEFNNLEASSWLLTSFALAGASCQSISGQLSDIFGRRPILALSYTLFAVGCALVGVGQSMWQVVLGRSISGAGGSAMGVVAALLISDLVPLRDVAAWQAGLNLAATTGRSLGGPVGGFLADTIGWRWSFTGQAPIFLLATLLSWLFLPRGHPTVHVKDIVEDTVPIDDDSEANAINGDLPPSTVPQQESRSSLARIDFLGAFLLAITILAILIPLDIGGKSYAWTHPVILLIFTTSLIAGLLFFAVESKWAPEPVFPLELLQKRSIVNSYFITGAMTAAQLGLMFSVPIYFQVTQRVSNAKAGAHLFPAVMGNALGAIVAGIIIKKTGHYKKTLMMGTFASAFSYFLLFVRWHGDTNTLESLYIIPSGFGMGITQTAIFTAIQASVDHRKKAPAIAGMYLTSQLGMILGLAIVSAVVMETVRWKLDKLLISLDISEAVRAEIIENAASNIDYLDQVSGGVYDAIVESYILGLEWSHLVSIGSSLFAFSASAFLREEKL
ncbi:Major facilitator superfamily transporter [Scedosporium apiospermum]|uniref:Major facilitator superfamily transporter n=1 Tax=Pseudallescheria apiosperma TaxID=563466 RepID=A0A084FYN5_PSEDA|nr:Major facilitator superfamily transporter [Scedosporium apiospermum]KEZ40197.1 Major facilitator superfamily transporter [Scedosporium apiospermum]